MTHSASESGFRPNQPVERFHGTERDRINPMRGLKSPESPIPRIIAIDYNFLRPQMSSGGRTPAQAAGIELPLSPNDGWGDLIEWGIRHRTLNEIERRSTEAERLHRAAT